MNYFDSFLEINWLAVLVVLFLSFVFGALWHSVLFKKAWTEDSKTIYNSENRGNQAVIFGLSAILHIILIVGLAVFIGAESTAFEGFIKGLIVSLIWISTSMGVTYIFAGRTFRLFLIDAGFYVFFMSVAGLILGAW